MGSTYRTACGWVTRTASCAALAIAASAQANYSDIWWDPAKPGRAIAVEDQGSARFALIFDYDTSGRPIWLVAPDLRVDDYGDYGTVYRTLQPGNGDPPGAESWIIPVGRMYLDLAQTPAYMYYDAYNRVWPSHGERYIFGKAAACDADASEPPPEMASVHGLWWNPA